MNHPQNTIVFILTLKLQQKWITYAMTPKVDIDSEIIRKQYHLGENWLRKEHIH